MNNDAPFVPPAAPTPPTQPPQPQQPFPPAAPQPTGGTDPGKTLGIVGLVLSLFTGIIGVIVSIIALVKSKKAGYKNIPALVGIIIGSLLFIVSVLFIGWALSRAMDLYNTCSQYINQKSVYTQCIQQQLKADQRAVSESPSGDTVRYEDANVVFSYPAEWTLTSAGSNVSHIDGNGVPADVWQNIKYKSSVLAQYASYDYGEKDRYTMEHIRSLMEPTVAKYTASTAQSVNATTGFGCAPESRDFSFISEPAYVEKEGLAGLSYSFECTGYSGKVRGVYYTTYDLAGNRHVLAGTVLNKDSSTYFDLLEDMVDSFQANTH